MSAALKSHENNLAMNQPQTGLIIRRRATYLREQKRLKEQKYKISRLYPDANNDNSKKN